MHNCNLQAGELGERFNSEIIELTKYAREIEKGELKHRIRGIVTAELCHTMSCR